MGVSNLIIFLYMGVTGVINSNLSYSNIISDWHRYIYVSYPAIVGTLMTSPPTVMVVEDEQELRRLYEDFLSDTINVVTVADAEEALEELGWHIDVVLLDRVLPGKRGDDIVDEIKDLGEFMVAMVTAVDPEAEIIDMGFDAYVTKPVGQQELNEVVDELLHARTYNEHVTELFRLSKKRAILREQHGEAALSDNEEFAALAERTQEILAAMDEIDNDFSDDHTDENVIFEKNFS